VQGNEIAALDPSQEADKKPDRQRFHLYCLHLNLHPQHVEHARGGSSDSSDEDMASYDCDIDCRTDEDEDDGRSPVYATRFSVHGVK